MSRAVRILLVFVGLYIAVWAQPYLHGGVLGNPPWWITTVPRAVTEPPAGPIDARFTLNPIRKEISACVSAAGLALAAFAAWPRRLTLVLVGLLPVADGAFTLIHARLEPRQEEPTVSHREIEAEGDMREDRLEPGLIERDVYRAPPVPLIVGGLALVAIGAWPRRRRQGGQP